MTDLNEIRERAEKALDHKISMFPNEVILIEQDVPALLAEVERLQPLAELGRMAKWITLCDCKFGDDNCESVNNVGDGCDNYDFCVKRAEIERSGK